MGRSGLIVSRLGLGTMGWGRGTDTDDAAAQLAAFVAAGGTLVDTANVYGDGDAERMLGTLLPDVARRAQVVLAATTVGVGGGRRALITALDESLRRLGTDSVDLWQVHGFDTGTPLEETVSALELAVRTGRAGYVGISGCTGWELAAVAGWAGAQGGPLVSAEVEYSLLERSPEESVLPAAAALGLGVLAWAPLGRGVLTGKYRHGTPADSRGASSSFARYVNRHRAPGADRVVDAVVTAAQGLGLAPLTVALAWARDRPGVATAIAGARTAPQLDAVLAADATVLPPEIVAALDEVSGGPAH
nr:aldo/keto reductase [Nakamurella leprariae]